MEYRAPDTASLHATIPQYIGEFARKHLGGSAVERDHEGGENLQAFREQWQTAAKSGILGQNHPERFGGQSVSAETLAQSLEALGYACPDTGLCLGMSGQIVAFQKPILEFGTDDQKYALLPGLISGSLLGSVCITEPDAGSDAASMKTQAVADGDGFIISGIKSFVGNAPVADSFLIFAKTHPERGSWGVSAFLARADQPGISVSKSIEKMGLRSLPMGNVKLDGLRVMNSSMLGGLGSGMAILRRTLEWERGLIFASSVGAMRRQLEEATEFARNREQFGKPITEFQSVSNRLADMRVRYETSRLVLLEAARALEAGQSASMISSISKLHLSEACYETALDYLRITGGVGYLKGHEAERALRDMVGGLIYSGTSDIQRNIIADLLP
ncbi:MULTISPECIES: acyl-CoA dehydrogenase family protein [unclassified Ruegeria]|uniref:acyl-CoA dehydrogenase family protein n=1 Tax=unclassified Ruegeria TaxID=2625375 RepID=UPI0014895682|nr:MULTISPECIES: acyl-CoA dehydrogenase family protein [unclassified Ruegeria]